MCEQVLSCDELLCEMPGREPRSFIWQSFLSDGLVPSGERPENKGRKARSLPMQTLTHPPAFVSVPLSPLLSMSRLQSPSGSTSPEENPSASWLGWLTDFHLIRAQYYH